MFSIENFIFPINNSSTSLKIRNKNNIVVHIIKEFSCTISINNNIVTIKQSAESSVINLSFSSKEEAGQAHILLRNSLKQLLDQNQSGGGGGPTTDFYIKSFNPTTTTILHVDSNISIPFIVSSIHKMWINGLYIHNDLIVYYSFNIIGNSITWKSNNEYVIDPTDVITLEYF